MAIADCTRKIAQYRAALDAGADPAVVAPWITQTEPERTRLRATARPDAPRTPSRDDIASVVGALADILGVLGAQTPLTKRRSTASLASGLPTVRRRTRARWSPAPTRATSLT
jgi:hypothetical protein